MTKSYEYISRCTKWKDQKQGEKQNTLVGFTVSEWVKYLRTVVVATRL